LSSQGEERGVEKNLLRKGKGSGRGLAALRCRIGRSVRNEAPEPIQRRWVRTQNSVKKFKGGN